MATSAAPTSQPGAVRDHGFHPLRIRRVVRETAEAASFVLDVPAELRAAFGYEAGQFLTFRAHLRGEVHHRCYSMSSSPSVDDELQVTVKRVPGGLVSNWMIDSLGPGDVVEASVPAGVFCLAPGDGEIVAFSAGSGITPVLSLLKTALATTSRRARLYYANRDREAVIFDAELDALAARHPDRLEVVHHLDVERGFVDAGAVAAFVEATSAAEFYVCGPTPFMDIVEGTLLAHGVDADRIHIERFTPAEPPPAAEPGPVAGADDRDDRHTGHGRARRADRQRRPPPGHDDPADRPPDGHGAAVLVRVGDVRDVHGQARRGVREDARQRRPDRRRGRGRVGADLPVRADLDVGARRLRGKLTMAALGDVPAMRSTDVREQRRGRAIAMTADEVDGYLREARTCRVGTIGADGSPHVSALWFVWDGAALWLNSLVKSQRWVNVVRSPRVERARGWRRRVHGAARRRDHGGCRGRGRGPAHRCARCRAGPARAPVRREVRRRSVRGQTGATRWLRVVPDKVVSWDFRKIASASSGR